MVCGPHCKKRWVIVFVIGDNLNMTLMRVGFISLLLLCLSGCGTSMTIEPNRAGAESGCADHSGNLSQYNDCMEQVDSFYREYEEHRKLSDQDKDR